MGFSGDLADIGLSDIFAHIASNRLAGTLTIFNEQRTFHVYFAEGKIAMATSPDAHTLLSTLPKRLAKRGLASLLTGEDVDAIDFVNRLTSRIREDVYEAFSWPGCQFEFVDGAPPEHVFHAEQLNADLALDVEPILMEAAHRTDEWGRIHEQIPSFEEVFAPVQSMGADQFGGEVVLADVFRMFDGQTDLTTILERSVHGRFEVCKATADLLREDWIRPISAEERIDLVERVAAADPEQGVRMIAGALEHDPENPILHYRLGELHASRGDRDQGAQSLCQAGDIYRSLGQDEDAVTSYRRAVEVSPSDAVVRERLFRVLVDTGEGTEAIQQGLELADTYTSLGSIDRARSLYVELSTMAAGDSTILERRAECERDVGNPREAVKIYATLANDGLKRNNLEYATAMLDNILQIDDRHADAKRMMRQIESSKKEVRASKRRRVRRAAVWSIGLGVLLYAVVYEVMARSVLHTIQVRNASIISRGGFLEAIRNYDGLRHSYPLSLTRLETAILIEELARGKIEQIENQLVLPDARRTIDDLQRILSLAVAPDIYERARAQITRVRVQQRVEDRFRQLRNPELRNKAIQWINTFDDRFAEGYLQGQLTVPDAETKTLALQPLINMKSLRAIPSIIPLLRDPNEQVRSMALKALLAITGHPSAETGFDYWNKWWRTEGSRRFRELTKR